MHICDRSNNGNNGDSIQPLAGSGCSGIMTVYLIGMMLYGHYRGFIKIAVSAMSLFITLFAARVAIPQAAAWLEHNTAVYETMKESALKASGLDEKMEEMAQTAGLAGKAGERAVIESLEIPDQIKKLLIENNNGEIYQEMGVQIFEDYVGKYLADRVIRVIIFTVLFIVFYAFLHIIIVWLNLISRLPILYGLNKIAGAVLGLAEALIFIWVGALVLTLFSGSEIGKSMIEQINGSIWLTWLYDHNMLSYLVVGLVKSVL